MSIESDFAFKESPIKFIEEATTRFGSIILLVLISSLAWIFYVDDVLGYLLNELVPCESSCTNLYDPYSWTRLRWISAFILSFIPLIPYTFYQTYRFLEPGLFLREKKYLYRVFFFVSFLFLLSVYVTVTLILPTLYSWGHDSVIGAGFSANYDAVSMLYLSVSIVWSIMVLTGYISITLSAGGLNIINQKNIDSWRWSLYSSLFFLIYLTTNFSDIGIQWIVLGIMILILESIISAYSTNFSTEIMGLNTILDSEYRERNILFVDCSCDGLIKNDTNVMINPVGQLSVRNLCESELEREVVLDAINYAKITDLIISGCSSDPLPDSFKGSCNYMSCNLSGLNLLSINSMRTSDKTEINRVQKVLCLSEFVERISRNLTKDWKHSRIEDGIESQEFKFGTCLQNNQFIVGKVIDESHIHKV